MTSKRFLFRGYTMVELLTVLGILSVIGSMVISIVFITLSGAKKSEKVEILRQNGDTTLSQIIRSIRYAKSLDVPASCVPSTNVSSITITSLADNQQTTFACGGNTISSNSASFLNTNIVKTTACSFTCSQATIADPPVITVQFTLSPVSSGSFSETQASIPFQSSVTLRNYSR